MDYTKLSVPSMLTELSDDPEKWAQAFLQFAARLDYHYDPALVREWFRDAVEGNRPEYGRDAVKWAAAFCRKLAESGAPYDEDWLIGWFANVIESTPRKCQ